MAQRGVNLATSTWKLVIPLGICAPSILAPMDLDLFAKASGMTFRPIYFARI